MKKIISFDFKTGHILAICLIFALLQISLESFTQNPPDFSGKWILNNSKSDSLFADVTSVIIISQENNVITFDITQTTKNAKPITKSEKYIIGTSQGQVSDDKSVKIETVWSSDKQSLLISEVNSYVENKTTKESRCVKVYSLTDEGKTMIVRYESTFPKGSGKPENERHNIMVYDKSL